MSNKFILPTILIILIYSVNLSKAQSSATKALEYYCKQKKIDTCISRSNVIKVIKLSDTRDSTVPFIDSFCSIVQDGASILGKEIYAIEIHNDSHYNVEMVWYSWTRDKLYLISDVNELENWIDDHLTHSIYRKINNNQRSKWFRRKTAYKSIKAQSYLAIMTYNCYYKQNLDLPIRMIKKRSRLRKYLAKHPLAFSMSKN